MMDERHYRAVFAGHRSRAAGEEWERLLEASCLHYRLKGEAEIEKTPEPMKPIGPKNTISIESLQQQQASLFDREVK